MNMNLTKYEIDDLIDRLQNGETIPDDFKYKLFPVKQKEYELVYGGKMRREDILANEDGVFPVPLQIEKIYNGHREQWKDGWQNIIAFGENLQFLKTIYENKDPLIKNKVKGKVKLIYIDPPFGTDSDFSANNSQLAYKDKAKGADFVEFLRRRLFVAKELLSDDGSIYVHLDIKKSHYVKVVLDEVFGEFAFKNEIIWQRSDPHNDAKKKYGNIHDVILYYGKSSQTLYNWDKITVDLSHAALKEYCWMRLKDGTIVPKSEPIPDGARIFKLNDATWKGNSKDKLFEWRGVKLKPGLQWFASEDELESMLHTGEIYLPKFPKGAKRCRVGYLDIRLEEGQVVQDIWQDVGRMKGGKSLYPTQKPEQLLERIIKASSNENDIVMDFFAGAGTLAAVAEKLNRKWLICDVGKLAFYTVQKRLLNIQTSSAIGNSNKQFGKEAKSFVSVNTGYYDLGKIFDLKQAEYSDFVMNLFEVEPKQKTISGIQIDGEKKDGYNVIIWQYWKFKDSTVDEDFLHNLHSHIGTKAGKRVYIIAPANYVDFISDYYEIENVRYYFLKVPYHIIRELHKVEFKKFRQPQSKSNVNDLEDAIGFHFMRQPDVKSELKEKDGDYHITIKRFLSDFSEEETQREMENFESLSMVLIDKDFNGNEFDMDAYYFAEDLLPKKKKKQDEEENENIKEELKHINQISLPPFPKNDCGERMMVIYIDIYGNEFKEEFKLIK
jgi:site-specific DNA-methyltransferase (adenine-specific)/adenine-specific DNA-methyltransferase